MKRGAGAWRFVSRPSSRALRWLPALGWAVACTNVPPRGDGSSTTTVSTQPLRATLTLPARLDGRPVNRMLLGNNVEWVERGDGLLRTDPAATFAPELLSAVDQLHPTVLRYPGGSHADLYHWRQGMGAETARGRVEHFFTKATQDVRFGTAEFLELCRRLGAEPLITTNVLTGTPDEAAAWVRATNVDGMRGRDGARLPSVRYWEVGNEPYLRETQQRTIAVEPEEFARRADVMSDQMRAVDRTILLGLPLRNDKLGIAPAVHFPNFAERLLKSTRGRYDFVALHNTYLPFIYDNARVTDDNVFRASMAATRVVTQDLDATRALLARLKPDWPARFAITEYNSMFTVGGRRDDNIETLGGALFVADVLMMFARRDDILMADYWSLSGNWHFGATDEQGRPRPAFRVLTAFERVMRGNQLVTTVTAPTFANERVGAVPAFSDTPLVTTFAAVEGDTLRMLVLNKDLNRTLRLDVRGPSRAVTAMTVRELGGTALYDARAGARLNWVDRPPPARTFPFELPVGPHTLAWVTIALGR